MDVVRKTVPSSGSGVTKAVLSELGSAPGRYGSGRTLRLTLRYASCVCFVGRFCHDYDLCSDCEQRGADVHDPSHVLLKMSLPCNTVRLSRSCIDSVLRRCITDSPRSVTTTTAAATTTTRSVTTTTTAAAAAATTTTATVSCDAVLHTRCSLLLHCSTTFAATTTAVSSLLLVTTTTTTAMMTTTTTTTVCWDAVVDVLQYDWSSDSTVTS